MAALKKEEIKKSTFVDVYNRWKPYAAGAAVGSLGMYGMYNFVPAPAAYSVPVSLYGGAMAGMQAYKGLGGKENKSSKTFNKYAPYLPVVPGVVYGGHALYNTMYPPRRSSFFPFA